MTAHMTLMGIDASGKPVQVAFTEENLPRLIRVESAIDGELIKGGPLSEFRVQMSTNGISFARNDKYLSAQSDSTTLVADRAVRAGWETFCAIPEDRISLFIKANVYRGNAEEAARFCEEVAKLQGEGKPVKIYCGAGTVPRPGFLNLDIGIYAPNFAVNNFREYFIFPFVGTRWDLPDNSVDYIFHEDFIEHITQLMQFQFLAETLRVLKPGCWHRVNTPNVLAAMKRHSNFKDGVRGVYTGETKWGHISIFSPLSLKEVAELVGYREVVFTTRNHGVSPYAEGDFRPGADRDEILGNIYADLLK